MAQNSQVKILEEQVRECFGKVVWTHKTHEKCADILSSRHNTIKLWQILLSAATTTGIVGIMITSEKWLEVTSAVVSFASFFLSTFVKKYNLEELIIKHRNAAIELWDIRESYLSLLFDIRACNLSCRKICAKRDSLQARLHKLYKGCPRTSYKAYQDASKALKENDELTFTDDEIDKFLPTTLQYTSSSKD